MASDKTGKGEALASNGGLQQLHVYSSCVWWSPTRVGTCTNQFDDHWVISYSVTVAIFSPVRDTVTLQFDHVLFIFSQRQYAYASSTYPYANLSPPVQSNEVSNGLVCMAMVHLWIHMIVLCPTGISWSGQTVLKSLCPEQGNFFLLRWRPVHNMTLAVQASVSVVGESILSPVKYKFLDNLIGWMLTNAGKMMLELN